MALLIPDRIDVHHFLHFDAGQLSGIESSLSLIKKGLTIIMTTTTEIRDAALAVKAKVDAFQPAVDAAEARITALIKQLGTLTPAQQAELDEAFGVLNAAASGADTAVTDLTDGVDEAETPPA